MDIGLKMYLTNLIVISVFLILTTVVLVRKDKAPSIGQLKFYAKWIVITMAWTIVEAFRGIWV